MHLLAEGKSKTLQLLLWITGIVLAASFVIVHTAAAQTVVGVTICANSSITIDEPISDSIVTETTVAISGTVSQAGQIEVRVDGAFNNVIPLSIGQTTYVGEVQLSAGTHDIIVTAINSCPGPNSSATSVVTYAPPPQSPSIGSETQTTVGGVAPPNVSENSAEGESVVSNSPGFLHEVVKPLESVATWLNIDSGSQTDQVRRNTFTAGRATALTAGIALAIASVAPAVVQGAATIPALASFFPTGTTTTRRRRTVAWTLRIAGVGLVISAFVFHI